MQRRLLRDDKNWEPGRLAKVAVVIAAGLWFLSLWLSAQAGADMAQGAFLQLLVPFMLAVIPMLAGHLAHTFSGGRPRVGDVAFAIALTLECAALVVVAVGGWL